MKLHLPKNLLRAVMALFVAHTAYTTAWAEETRVTTTLTEDKTYGYGGETWDRAVWELDSSKELYITSDPQNAYSLSFDGKDGVITTSAISAGSITVEAVKSLSISNVSMPSFHLGSGMCVSGRYGKIIFNGNGADSAADTIVVTNNSIAINDDNALGGWMYAGAVEIANTTGNIKVADNSVSSTWDGGAVNGGAIVGEQLVNIHHDDDIYYTNNSATGKGNTCGGAICALAPDGTSLNVEANGNVVFSGNSAGGHYLTIGGAIGALSDVVIKDNNSITFSANKCIATGNTYGGAIYSLAEVKISGNVAADAAADSVAFCGNSLSAANSAFGGAISATTESVDSLMPTESTGHNVTLENNGNINFSNNSIETDGRGRGGAIYADNHIALTGNAGVKFEGNNITTKDVGSAVGGAVAANFSQASQTPIETSSVAIKDNTGKISFKNNTVTAERWTAHGGAVYSAGQLTIQGNKSDIEFTGNKATADIASDASGGAIMTVGQTIISENEGNISFADNTVSSQGGNTGGGAIVGFGTGIRITDNAGTVTFSVNKVEGVSGYVVTDSQGDVIKGTDKLILGGAIASFASVDVTGNGAVTFSGNSVSDSFVESINTTDADSVDFGVDYVFTAGGAIASLGSINLTGNSGLTIENNRVQSNGRTAVGGALAAMNTVNISGNTGAVKVNDNGLVARGYVEKSANGYSAYNDALGGAIYAQKVIIDGNAAGVNVSGNSLVNNWSVYGGAIAATNGVSLSNNGAVVFNDNYAVSAQNIAYGGAIYSGNGVIVDNNTSVEFCDNYLKNTGNYDSRGGAIYSSGDVVMSNNGSVKFEGNSIEAALPHWNVREICGGAIYTDSSLTIGGEGNGNGDVSFIGNKIVNTDDASVHGGAIYAGRGDAFNPHRVDITISYNANVTFDGNVVSNTGDGSAVSGGAIYGNYADVNISYNSGVVTFKNNIASSGDMGAHGGAIGTLSPAESSSSGGNVYLIGNQGGVVFDDNHIYATTNIAAGAAIGTAYDVVLALNGGVDISNNTCINYNTPIESDLEGGGLNVGGAITALLGTTHLSYNQGDVNVTDNGVAVQNGNLALGGAIIASGLSIVGNTGNVTFAGNFESCAADSSVNELYGSSGTILRSIVVLEGGFELAAAEGKSITFYDSIYVAANEGMAVLNGYSDLSDDGNIKVSTGDIIFSGARTEQDLAAVQEYLKSQNFSAAASDAQASRTSVIERDVLLAAGSLQVIDGAVLRVGKLDGTTGNMLYLIDGQREAAPLGVAYPEGHKPELVVSAGSRIEAGSIIFDSNTEFTVVGSAASLEDAVTFSMREAAPVAELQADTVTMTGGMTYTQDGAYTLLVGESNTLTIDVSNGLAFTLNLDDSVAYTEGELTYFVLFTDVETLQLNGAAGWDEVGVTYSAEGYEDFAMGYHAETGTLYVSAKSTSNPTPEPTTATLSLLALAALAARRRRK